MKQALAVSYEMQKKNKRKKMADGGPVSAKIEQKPMPEETNNDKKMVMKNDHLMSENKMIKPKIQKISGPSMVKSNAFTAKLKDEDNIMESMPPKDETKHIAYDDKHALESQNFADGGMIDKNEQPQPEADKEHYDSIASAIMAKRKMMAEGGRVVPNHPGDSELEEGQVDYEDNAYELPNAYYKRNDEILKENYDSDFHGLSQPKDSNEHGHDIESDVHDMVSKIRSQMNKQRQFKVK